MSDTVQAVVTRKRGINGVHADGDVIPLAENQFEDWRSLGWVDRATPEQIEKAQADAEAAKAKEKAEKAKSAPKTEPKANTKA